VEPKMSDVETQHFCHNHPDRPATVVCMHVWWCESCYWDIEDGYGLTGTGRYDGEGDAGVLGTEAERERP
jgi:hypothetical protein